MKLLVCFKVVNDLDSVMAGDWDHIADENMDIGYTKRNLNCFDESALEIALRLCDQVREKGGEAEVTALTIAPRDSHIENWIKNLFAVKYTDVVKIECAADLRFNPRGVAAIISRYVQRNEKFDAIFLGMQAGVGDNGQTGLLAAEMLGLPCITEVSEVTLERDYLRIVSRIDGGVKRQTVTSPVVIAVGNARWVYLRVATLREKMTSAKRQPTIITQGSLGMPNEKLATLADTTLCKLYRENREKRCIILEGADAAEKARLLYSRYIRKAIGQ
jgi:electron transfer flavoprotein beta subunit